MRQKPVHEEFLHTFRVLRHYAPTNRYQVQLQYHDQPASVHWISYKQYMTLENAFSPYGYSTKERSVIGVFDGDRFCFAKWECGEFVHYVPPTLDIPESVEIAEELRDA